MNENMSGWQAPNLLPLGSPNDALNGFNPNTPETGTVTGNGPSS